MREWLLDGFRYDLWANRRWAPLAMGGLEEVGKDGSTETFSEDPSVRMREVFAHILWAQRVWLERIGLVVSAEGEGWLDALHEGWITILQSRDPEEAYRFVHRVRGPEERTVGGTALHVMNHGTYHRGQLREIVDRAGLDWPETDLGRWLLETASPSVWTSPQTGDAGRKAT